jgi:hypothetical protein
LTFWTVERVRPPPKKEPYIPESMLDDEISDEQSEDKYVSYPMKDFENEAYHSDESVEEQVTTTPENIKFEDENVKFQDEDVKFQDERNPDQMTESAPVERERPVLRRTMSNRDAVFDKVIRNSRIENSVTDYMVEPAKDDTGEIEHTVELRNKRIRVKSKDKFTSI